MTDYYLSKEHPHRQILLFGYHPFESQQQDYQMARQLSKTNNVLFVEPQNRWDRPNRAPSWWSFLPASRSPHPRQVSSRLQVIASPPELPTGAGFIPAWLRNCAALLSIRLSHWWLAGCVRHSMSRLDFVPDVIIVYDPRDLLVLRYLHAPVTCWRVYDEVALFDSNTLIRKALEEIEEWGLSKVDLVFASSQSQFERRKPRHEKTFFVPNACDFELYSRAYRDHLPRPAELRDVKSSVVGFVGRISEKIDWELISQVAAKRPDWSLVFVGPIVAKEKVLTAVRQLQGQSDVLFVGPKPVESLSGYLSVFDVCIIPYLINESTNTMYPVKLHECLATGKPVVATGLRELQPFSAILELANDADEFVQAIASSLAVNDPTQAAKRVVIARENSWQARAQQVSELLEEELAKPTVPG